MNQQLLLRIVDDVEDSDIDLLREVVRRAEEDAVWTVGPPQLVDQDEEDEDALPGDEPIRIVGVILAVTAPGVTPGTSRAEVRSLVDRVAELSRARGFVIEVQLDQTFAGSIHQGVPDRLLVEGLLATW